MSVVGMRPKPAYDFLGNPPSTTVLSVLEFIEEYQLINFTNGRRHHVGPAARYSGERRPFC